MKDSMEFVKLGPPDRCRVFQAHAAPGLDFSLLKEYGTTVIPLYEGFKGFIHPDDPDWRGRNGQPEATLRLLKASSFEPHFDYIALGGDILRCVTLGALIARVWGRFVALRFDNREGRYYPFFIDLTHMSALSLQQIKEQPND